MPWRWIRPEHCKISPLAYVSHGDGDSADASRMSDNQLALKAQQDVESFSALFDRFFTPVYRFFFVRLRDHADAEDLTSETFQKVFTKLHTFQDRGLPFSSWVFAIARNSLTDHLRKSKHQTDSLDELAESGHEPGVDFDLKKMDDVLLTEQVWEAIRTLPEQHQQVWALKLSADLKHKDIAEVLGLTESNVNVIIHRSLARLKQKLSRKLVRHHA